MRPAFAALYVIFDPRKWLPHRSNGQRTFDFCSSFKQRTCIQPVVRAALCQRRTIGLRQ